mgnify:CR=1 FL=1
MDDDEDFGTCEVAGCGRDAEHRAQVTRNGEQFGHPLSLCDDHVIPYMGCGDAECDEEAAAVMYFARGDDVRRVFACPGHELELRTGAQILIDGERFELDDDARP